MDADSLATLQTGFEAQLHQVQDASYTQQAIHIHEHEDWEMPWICLEMADQGGNWHEVYSVRLHTDASRKLFQFIPLIRLSKKSHPAVASQAGSAPPKSWGSLIGNAPQAGQPEQVGE